MHILACFAFPHGSHMAFQLAITQIDFATIGASKSSGIMRSTGPIAQTKKPRISRRWERSCILYHNFEAASMSYMNPAMLQASMVELGTCRAWSPWCCEHPLNRGCIRMHLGTVLFAYFPIRDIRRSGVARLLVALFPFSAWLNPLAICDLLSLFLKPPDNPIPFIGSPRFRWPAPSRCIWDIGFTFPSFYTYYRLGIDLEKA